MKVIGPVVGVYSTAPRSDVVVRFGGHFPIEVKAPSIPAARLVASQILTRMDPTKATGILFVRSSGDNDVFSGTAFAFRSGRYFLTARHCIDGVPAKRLRVKLLPYPKSPLKSVSRVVLHPTADLAMLDLGRNYTRMTPFLSVGPPTQLGAEFWAFGYPEDILSGGNEPTPRLFVGHFQRSFDHRDLDGYAYRAKELSIPAPTGLSGGPIMNPGDDPPEISGVVTANFDSTTIMDSHEQEIGPGVQKVVHYQRVISYGIGLALTWYEDWLDEVIPKKAP